MPLIRVLQLHPITVESGWDYYEDKYALSSYSDQYSTGWEEVDEEKLKEIQKALETLNRGGRRYSIIQAHNKVGCEDLIAEAARVVKLEEKARKERALAKERAEKDRAAKVKLRKLKQLEKLKKELEEVEKGSKEN